MPKFKRKPSDPIEAVQFFPTLSAEVEEFIGETDKTLPPENGKHNWDQPSMTLRLWNSEERQHITVPAGHWIAKGGAGEFYPISAERFEALYEPEGSMDVAEAQVIT